MYFLTREDDAYSTYYPRILLRVPPVKSYQALRQRKKTVDGLKRRKKFSSSCSVITKRSFAIKHTICQNGNLLQLNYTRDAGKNTFQATRRRNNVKLKWAISQKNTRQPKTNSLPLVMKKGGDEEADKEAEGGVELVSKHFQDMDEILGKRRSHQSSTRVGE